MPLSSEAVYFQGAIHADFAKFELKHPERCYRMTRNEMIVQRST